MKQVTGWLLAALLFSCTSAHAVSWAFAFVAWNGHVYEVTEEMISENQIVEKIGEVNKRTDEETGEYYGDASNFYPLGTGYYEMEGIETEKAIAVEIGPRQWAKAIYAHEAPFHWMELFTKWLPGILLTAAGLVIIWQIKKRHVQGD